MAGGWARDGAEQEQIDATAMAVDTILGQTEYSNA